jgi:hypothetical protein
MATFGFEQRSGPGSRRVKKSADQGSADRFGGRDASYLALARTDPYEPNSGIRLGWPTASAVTGGKIVKTR